MKNLIVLIMVFLAGNLHAKYYIGDWGFEPCCGTNCYWFWADIWDDNGTNNIADDRFVGTARRLSCGISFRADGTVDIDKSLNNESSLEFPEMNDMQGIEKIVLFPNPATTNDLIQIKNLPADVRDLHVTVINLTNQQRYQINLNNNTIAIPDWMPKGLYQIIIQSPDQRVYVEQRLVIE